MPRRVIIDGHYARCDICGEGWDRIIVNFPARAGQVWSCETNSRCHGNKTLETVDVTAVQQFLSDNEYLMATRNAIRKYVNLVKSIEVWAELNPVVATAPATAPLDPEEHGPEVIAVMPDEMFDTVERDNDPEVVFRHIREWATQVAGINMTAAQAATAFTNIGNTASNLRLNIPLAG